jgi:hypothetical protein
MEHENLCVIYGSMDLCGEITTKTQGKTIPKGISWNDGFLLPISYNCNHLLKKITYE